jgi:NAD+ synthetase
MRIRLVQLNPIIGDIRGNAQKMLAFYRQAVADEIDLVIFPELSITGYPPMDLLERAAFLDAVDAFVAHIEKQTSATGILFGAPVRNTSGTGRPIFNAAILAAEGKRIDTVYKTLLPTYDVFDDFRYFEPNKTLKTTDFRGLKLGISICEDFWNNENEMVYHRYDIDVARQQQKMGAQLLINISASPFAKNKSERRQAMLEGHTLNTGLPFLYCNQAGANTEIIFDGDSMAISGSGSIVARAPLFEECTLDVMFQDGSLRTEKRPAPLPQRTERLFLALKIGLRDYVKKSRMQGDVVLGLSGGIDSALVAVLAKEALGADKVHAVMMPSAFSSEHSISDAEALAKNLGIHVMKIPVNPAYDAFISMLAPYFAGLPFSVAEENLQSRTRGVVLMALSNKFGWMLLNTGNKSEMATGYCTLYGDMAGGLSVIADVYKTEVYALCHWLNGTYYGREVIPRNILTKPPSAELRPNQKDTDSLPEYDILDAILEGYIEQQFSRERLVAMGHPAELVDRVMQMVDRNEYKRRQAAPGLRVSTKAFGYGRRLPIVQGWTGHEQDLNDSL